VARSRYNVCGGRNPAFGNDGGGCRDLAAQGARLSTGRHQCAQVAIIDCRSGARSRRARFQLAFVMGFGMRTSHARNECGVVMGRRQHIIQSTTGCEDAIGTVRRGFRDLDRVDRKSCAASAGSTEHSVPNGGKIRERAAEPSPSVSN